MNWVETAIFANKFTDNLIRNTKKNIKDNFKEVYLSHNLVDTMSVEKYRVTSSTTFLYCNLDFTKGVKIQTLHIPAIRYDIKKFQEEGVVVHNPEEGSYASEVNITGGFSPKKVHLGYIESAILDSIPKSYRNAKYGLGKTMKIKIKGVRICR